MNAAIMRCSFLFLLLAFSLIACKNKEYAKLKSSTRRVSSEMRYLERNTAGLAAVLGIGAASESVDTTVT